MEAVVAGCSWSPANTPSLLLWGSFFPPPEKSLLGSSLCPGPLPLVLGTPELCSVLGGAPQVPPPLQAEQPRFPQPSSHIAHIASGPAWWPCAGLQQHLGAQDRRQCCRCSLAGAEQKGRGSPRPAGHSRPHGTRHLQPVCPRDTLVSSRPLGPWLSPLGRGHFRSSVSVSILSRPVCQKPLWP